MKNHRPYFLSQDELRKLQMIELELLVEADRLCRVNHIKYSLDGGTLLGAVRHGGFIPWDDDADIIMVRDEYEKFRTACKNQLDPEKFYFQDYRDTAGYRWGYGKLRRKGTRFIRLGQEHFPYEQGVFLDVFPCDNVPENYMSRCLCNFHSYLYRKVFWSAVAVRNENSIRKAVYWFPSKIPEKWLKTSYSKYVKKRNETNSSMVKCLTFPACNSNFGYRADWYTKTAPISFEGFAFEASEDFDGYLSFLYGDYQVLPPPEKRKIHPVSDISLFENELFKRQATGERHEQNNV